MGQIILHGGVGSSEELSGLLDKYASYSINYETPLDAVVAAVKYMRRDIEKRIPVKETKNLDEVVESLDVLYVTRIQKNRLQTK